MNSRTYLRKYFEVRLKSLQKNYERTVIDLTHDCHNNMFNKEDFFITYTAKIFIKYIDSILQNQWFFHKILVFNYIILLHVYDEFHLVIKSVIIYHFIIMGSVMTVEVEYDVHGEPSVEKAGELDLLQFVSITYVITTGDYPQCQ